MRERALGKPDLVALGDIAQRLGVAPTTVSRWQRRSMLPEPDLRIGSLEVWVWETVRRWGERRNRFARKREQRAAIPDLVDAGEIATRLAVDPRTLENWIGTGAFPRPDYRWDTVVAWLWETVDVWAQTSLRRVPQVTPAREASGPRLHPAREDPATASPARGAMSSAPARSLDPIGDIERIHRYFSDLARSLETDEPSDHAAVNTIP